MSLKTISIEHEILTHRLKDYLNTHFNLDERIKAFKNRRFYSLEVELTNSCNLECCYCYSSSCRNSSHPDMTLEVVKKILKLSSEYGIKSIGWLGGEPLLHKDLETILKKAKYSGIKNILFTNGSLLSKAIWQNISDTLDHLVLHLDTIDKDIFEQIHNINHLDSKYFFSKTLKNLDNVLDSGYPKENISLYIVLSQLSYTTLKQTLEWAIFEKQLGMTTLFPLVPAGRGRNVDSDLRLSNQEIKNAFELRAKYENRPELLLLGPSEYCKHYQHTMAYIEVNGSVTPYAGIPFQYGNIANQNLQTIFDNFYEQLSFSNLVGDDGDNQLIGQCGNCSNSAYCFGTRASAFSRYEFLQLSDPFCWHIRK